MIASPLTALPRIFVVDDEADAREMVGEYLGMHGFEVTLCDGGASLRQKLNDKKPDLVVLDLNMPEEDGLSIVRYLKQTCPVPVIMLAAQARSIVSSDSKWAPTIIWQSAGNCASCSRVSAPFCGG